jgi:hypothetical protein
VWLVCGIAKKLDQEETAVPKHAHHDRPAEQVTSRSRSWRRRPRRSPRPGSRDGRQVVQTMLTEDVARPVGPKGHHSLPGSRCATPVRPLMGAGAGVASVGAVMAHTGEEFESPA